MNVIRQSVGSGFVQASVCGDGTIGRGTAGQGVVGHTARSLSPCFRSLPAIARQAITVTS